jgi:hypothetical protein
MVSEIVDAAARYQQIAANFLHGHEGGQNTLVVSPVNDERRALNLTIRELLVAHGHVAANGRQHEILVAKDLTRAQMRYARNYTEGDVVHFSRNHPRRGIAWDSCLTVTAVNRAGNSLTLRTGAGYKSKAVPHAGKPFRRIPGSSGLWRRATACNSEFASRAQEVRFLLQSGPNASLIGEGFTRFSATAEARFDRSDTNSGWAPSSIRPGLSFDQSQVS